VTPSNKIFFLAKNKIIYLCKKTDLNINKNGLEYKKKKKFKKIKIGLKVFKKSAEISYDYYAN